MKSAAKVGALLVVFIVLVFGSFAVLGRSAFAHRHRTFFVSLPDAGGLLVGTRVLMAGVQIGAVDKISLAGPHRAQLTLLIDRTYQIPEGSEAIIEGSLIGLGDTPLTIEAPAASTTSLPEGSTIPGRRAGPLDSMLPNGGRDLYSHVNQTLTAVQRLLEDRRLQGQLKAVLQNASATLKTSQATMARFEALASRTDAMLARNEGNFDAMVQAARGSIEQVHYTAGTLAAFVKEGKLQNGTTAILDKAQAIESQAADLLASLDKTVNDPQIHANLSRSLSNVADTTAKGPAIADNAEKITANVAKITEEAKPLPGELSTVARKASALEDKLDVLLDKVNKVKPLQGVGPLSAELDVTRQTSPGYWRTDVNGTLPIHDVYLTFGVYDAFESNRLNLELGHLSTPSLGFRYGAYAGKPAIGVDYSFAPKFGLRSDLWNMNSPELDARLRYDFGSGVIGYAGFERILSGTYPAIGLGYRK